jgi:hypothetical protein
MLSTKSSLLACLLGAGVVVAVGCSASGAADDLTALQNPATPSVEKEAGPSVVIPPKVDSGETPDDDENDEDAADASVDAGNKDAGPKDAGPDAAKDAGPPAPAPGSACAVANQVYQRPCGTCGKQSALCVADADGGAGGIVSDYGACRNEVANGCVPGTQETVACGNCGTQVRTCNAFCGWSSTSCQGQPPQSCSPNTVELDGQTCQDNTYRQRSCSASCTWGNYSAQCEAPPSSLVVPNSVGGLTHTFVTLTEDQTAPLLSDSDKTCPITTFSTDTVPYAYVEVKNPGPKAVTVSIFTSQPSGASELDTFLAVYQGATIPTTDAARKACKGYAKDYGNSTLTGGWEYASLDGSSAVTIAPNSSVQVYVASHEGFSVSTTTGSVKVGVKTDAIAP